MYAVNMLFFWDPRSGMAYMSMSFDTEAGRI